MGTVHDDGSIRFTRSLRTDRRAERRAGQRYLLHLIEKQAPFVLDQLLDEESIHLYRVAINRLSGMGVEVAHPDQRVGQIWAGQDQHPDALEVALPTILKISSVATPIGLARSWFYTDALYTMDRRAGLPGWHLHSAERASIAQPPLPLYFDIDYVTGSTFASHDDFREYVRRYEAGVDTIRIEIPWATHVEPWESVMSKAKAALQAERRRIEEKPTQPEPIVWPYDLIAAMPDAVRQVSEDLHPIKPRSWSQRHFGWLIRHVILGQSLDKIVSEDLHLSPDPSDTFSPEAVLTHKKTVASKIQRLADFLDVDRPAARKRGRPRGARTVKSSGLRVRASRRS